MRVSYPELIDTFRRTLLHEGMSPSRAELCARLFADASADGVPSHGLNRFPLFVAYLRSGRVDVMAEPECVATFGGLERWQGHRGPGPLNAHHCMNRAIELARSHGIGAVALADTNHWMRGANYGWQAADAGVVGICWTNTLPNMPPWGATSPAIGNNPFVIAVPRTGGHVVLDMAMSQFSYGKIAVARMRGEELPVDGGYDADGRLTRSPAAIEATGRVIPTGYWKGSALAIVLDVVATMLSGGRSTHQIPADPRNDSGQSQVFIAIDPSIGGAAADANDAIDAIVRSLHDTPGDVRYPGERTLATRRRSMAEGVEVEPSIWAEVQSLAKASNAG